MIRDAIRRRRVGGREALVASLEDLAGRLAHEEQARAAFIGKVSHELRTPLTVIKGYVYTLQRAEADSGKAAKLKVIDGECERLSYMIESLLELSRARAGHLRVCDTPFALRACVEEVAERLRAVASHRGVGVAVRWSCGDVTVSGDENRVRQVFANIIGNAIKYAPPDTDVVVSAETPACRWPSASRIAVVASPRPTCRSSSTSSSRHRSAPSPVPGSGSPSPESSRRRTAAGSTLQAASARARSSPSRCP